MKRYIKLDKEKFIKELNEHGKPSNLSNPYSWIIDIIDECSVPFNQE